MSSVIIKWRPRLRFDTLFVHSYTRAPPKGRTDSPGQDRTGFLYQAERDWEREKLSLAEEKIAEPISAFKICAREKRTKNNGLDEQRGRKEKKL